MYSSQSQQPQLPPSKHMLDTIRAGRQCTSITSKSEPRTKRASVGTYILALSASSLPSRLTPPCQPTNRPKSRERVCMRNNEHGYHRPTTNQAKSTIAISCGIMQPAFFLLQCKSTGLSPSFVHPGISNFFFGKNRRQFDATHSISPFGTTGAPEPAQYPVALTRHGPASCGSSRCYRH